MGISLAFGLLVMAMIYALGNVSGAHLNPAVTLGFVAAGRLPARQFPLYMGGQVVGAVLAFPTCRLTQGSDCCVPVQDLEGMGRGR